MCPGGGTEVLPQSLPGPQLRATQVLPQSLPGPATNSPRIRFAVRVPQVPGPQLRVTQVLTQVPQLRVTQLRVPQMPGPPAIRPARLYPPATPSGWGAGISPGFCCPRSAIVRGQRRQWHCTTMRLRRQDWLKLVAKPLLLECLSDLANRRLHRGRLRAPTLDSMAPSQLPLHLSRSCSELREALVREAVPWEAVLWEAVLCNTREAVLCKVWELVEAVLWELVPPQLRLNRSHRAFRNGARPQYLVLT